MLTNLISQEINETSAKTVHNEAHRYFIVNKPYNIVSQFVSSHRVGLLGDLDFDFPEGTHAIGRLDNNSEGLLLLTTNKKITKLLFEGAVPHKRVYLVQVRHEVSEDTLQLLRQGVSIIVKGGGNYTTQPCQVEIVHDPGDYFNDTKPLMLRPPYTWLLLTLTEGKFHQVRKMVDVVHHQCRRLIRVAIEDLMLGEIPAGGVQEIEEVEFFEKLKI